MNKFLSLMVISLSLVGGANAASPVGNAKEFTVLVAQEGLTGGGRASGVLLDSTHVLTCAHVVVGGGDLYVYTYPMGRVIAARVEYTDTEDDMAVLVLESSAAAHTYPILQPVTHEGERIFVVGNVLGSMQWYITSGVISGHEQRYLLTDASIHPGNSGGPWINEKGEVVAITNWGLSDRKGGSLGISGGLSAARILQVRAGYTALKKLMAALMGA